MAHIATTSHKQNVAAFRSSSMPASTNSSHYDVFINHRGPDVKNTFASHLYIRLLSSGMRVFLDREELEEGQNISSQIEEAIRGASIHIAIFSPRYAQSSWCLNELVLMIKSGATILPVFYKVDPSVVGRTVNDGVYAAALRGLQQKTTQDSQTGEEKPRYGSDTIHIWRKALSDVADLSGFVLQGDEEDEGELLDNVVESVLKKVPKTPVDVAKYPTGLDLKLEEFEKTVLFQEQEMERVEAKVVGIVGVGGIGKTTLAKEFFNRRRSYYNTSSFLFDVRENARTVSPSYLQNKLLSDLKQKDGKIDNRDEGIEILKRHLSSCHALIIIDDVDHMDQLETILPIKKTLRPDSLILVTSRDKHVLRISGVLESSIYSLKGMNEAHSKELFCSYAFHMPAPLPEFTDLVDRYVRACDGLPLSLKVIGALVCGQKVSYWEEQWDRLQCILPNDIHERLKISYDSLNKEDQRVFLDIVCFFIGEYRDKAIRIWGLVGFQHIEDKCLLDVDNEYKIKMHDHIRDMGRRIAEEGSMPRRLWHSQSNTNIIDDLLQQSSSRVNTEVRGITAVSSSVDFFRINTERYGRPNYTSSDLSPVKTLEMKHLFNNFHHPGMRNLQLVATEEDNLEHILRRVQPPHLLWLRWYKCSYSSLPHWISMKNLRVLEVEGSRLDILWSDQSQAVPLQLRELNICDAPLSEIPKSIGQLKYLERIAIWNNYSAPTLKRLPDEFCDLRSLKYLVFTKLFRIVSLPDSFGDLTNLQHIDLKGASRLQMLPNSFGNLNQLKHLSLEGAYCLQTLPNSFGNLTRFKHLSLSDCKSLTISNGTLENISMLEYLDLSSCKQMKELPPQVAHQRSLQKLYLLGSKLKEFPTIIGDLCNLQVLLIGSDVLEALPLGLGDLKCLKMLILSESPQLKCLPDCIGLLTQLTELEISGCGIEYLPQELLKMKNLEHLTVKNCPLRGIPFKKEVGGERETLLSVEGEKALHKLNSDDKCMVGLKWLQLSGTEINELYFDEGVSPNLQQLYLGRCYELRQLGGLCRLPKLLVLEISRCPKVEGLPGLEMLISLQSLAVDRCEKLKSIPGLGKLTELRLLYVYECPEIQELLGVEHLTSLDTLEVTGCKKLLNIQGLGQLKSLRRLNITECSQIQHDSLPSVERLTCLETLDVTGCQKLQNIEGLGKLTKLKELGVSKCYEIPELPGLEHLTLLEKLNVSGLEKLKIIQGLRQLTQLRELDVSECHEIPELPGLEHLIFLQKLNLSGLEKLKSIQGLGQLTELRELDVSKCHEIPELPDLGRLIFLYKLNVSGLEKLKTIQGLGQLTELRELDVSKCHEIPELPDLGHLIFIYKLNVSGLEKLKTIQGLGQLTQIRELDVSECVEIQELPGVECLTFLEKLDVSGLRKLKSIQGLGQLTNIIELDVSECYELQELPGVENLSVLQILNARECPKLHWSEGVLEQLRQELKDGFTYEKQRKRCSCLSFLQSLF